MAIYLKIDGMNANATSSKQKGYMNVSSYSWGFSVPVSTSGGAASNRQTPGKVDMGELHVTKEQDSTTATLMTKAFSGASFATANLLVTRMNKGAEVEMARYDMTHVILSNYQTGGSDGPNNPTESLSLNFATMTISQTSTDASNTGSGPVRANWDIGQQTGS